HHRRRCAGALPEHVGRLWRERHRLAALCARPHGFRIRGPLPRPDETEAERVLAPAMPRHVPVRPDRREARRGYGRRDLDVGFRLSASRRRLAGILMVYRRAVRRSAGGCRAQDHLRERRQVLRPDQLTAGQPGCPVVIPAKPGSMLAGARVDEKWIPAFAGTTEKERSGWLMIC